MSPSDKIGLLPGFGWIADQEWFGTSVLNYFFTCLAVCWLITPVGHVVWAFVSQAYAVPLTSDKQFQSFFPGDLFLGAAVAVLLTVARQMPDDRRDQWFQSPIWHASVLAVTFVVASVMLFVVERPNLTFTQLVSPSKLYHTYVLYCLYGYVIITTLFAAIAGNWGSWTVAFVVLAFVAAAPWVYWCVQDASLPKEVAMSKQAAAHPSSYQLFWVIPIAPK